MSSADKHSHIEQPSAEQIGDVLIDVEPELRQVYLEVHRLLLETLPDLTYSIDEVDGVTGYGARQHGYDGWGMAALAAHAKWVSLMFMAGAHLEDPDGVLEGGGKNMRHVKIRSFEHLEQVRGSVRALVETAARLKQT